MPQVPVYILAGGQSRRFGSDKARALIGGKPMLRHVAEAARPVASRIAVVAREPGQYTDLGYRTIADHLPGRGPLGGLEAALADCADEPWLLLLACDFIGLRSEWLRRLIDTRSEACEILLFQSEPPQPLCALYSEAVRSKVEQQLAQNALAVRDLLPHCRVHALPAPPGWEGLRNLNEPPPGS